MKGKFVRVLSIDIDREASIMKLSLECGHTLDQKRSPSFLDKEQFQTLRTPQGKPLRAHCKVCKQATEVNTVEETLEHIVNSNDMLQKSIAQLNDMISARFKNADVAEIQSLQLAQRQVILMRNNVRKCDDSLRNVIEAFKLVEERWRQKTWIEK